MVSCAYQAQPSPLHAPRMEVALWLTVQQRVPTLETTHGDNEGSTGSAAAPRSVPTWWTAVVALTAIDRKNLNRNSLL